MKRHADIKFVFTTVFGVNGFAQNTAQLIVIECIGDSGVEVIRCFIRCL
jgi:hypothetical protein